MVICLERGADLHTAKRIPLPLTVFCFSKIQIGFIFLVPAHLGSPGKGPLNRCACESAQHVIPRTPPVHTPNGISIRSAVLAKLTVATDRQINQITDEHEMPPKTRRDRVEHDSVVADRSLRPVLSPLRNC